MLEAGKKEGPSFCFSSPVSISCQQNTAQALGWSFLCNSEQQCSPGPCRSLSFQVAGSSSELLNSA